MTTLTQPITPSQFALAIQDLPIETIYSKAHEINNSITHLQKSNAQLQEYSDSIKNDTSLDAETRGQGDKDCLDAIRENDVVIERQMGRVGLLRGEVERRGMRWHEGDVDVEGMEDGRIVAVGNGTGSLVGGGGGQGQNQLSQPQTTMTETQTHTQTQPQSQAPPQRSGRLTDEELRRQIESLHGRDDNDDEDEGMHL